MAKRVFAILLGGFILFDLVSTAGGESLAVPLLAPVGTGFTYQGYLEDGGLPANADYDFEFRLYDANVAGSQIGSPVALEDVAVMDGQFSVVLDFGDVFDGTALWLQIGVRTWDSVGPYTTLSPRQAIHPTPYAISADRLDGLDSSAFSLMGHDHYGESWSGSAEYSAFSVGTDSPAGRGVTGSASATTGSPRGVQGYANAPGGRGVSGLNNATSGSAVGVRGETYSSSGYGVFGFSTVGAGVGGQSQASYGTGVYGIATGSESSTGVYGESDGTQGRGVSGFATSTTGSTRGVSGYSNSTSGYDFYAAGPGANYGPFTGAHEVRLSSSFPLDVKAGMIVCVTGEAKMRKATNGSVEISSTLPTVRLADTAEDKAVFGVLVAEVTLPEDYWYEAMEGERFASVNALGEGRVWVSNLNGDIEAGDYITTSILPGYGQRQDDDLLHNFTLAKATETIDWDMVTETVKFNGETYKVYLLAVVYTSG